MTFSRIDTLYRKILLTKYFVKGWGKPYDLKRLLKFKRKISLRGECFKMVPQDYPVYITKEHISNNMRLIEGYFISPFNHYFSELLPTESKKAYFQILLPSKWKSKRFKPVCLHMAGTGDQYFWRRRHLIAKPLLAEGGVASIILENPFYGLRKPKSQVRSILHNVSDIFVMGGCLVMESVVLFNWCLRNGLGPLGVTGISMGGHMASLAAASWPKPIVLVPCLSWSTASTAFTQGVMTGALDWDLLRSQLNRNEAYKNDVSSLATNPIFDDGLYMNKRPEGHNTVVKHSINNFFMETMEKSVLLKRIFNRDRFLPFIESYSIADYIHKIFGFNNSLEYFHSSTYNETISFMRFLMDECTHLNNFPVPIDPSLIICICALNDGYVPRSGVSDLTSIWPGMEVRYLNAGHVSAFLFHQKTFRNAIIEGFKRYQMKYM